MQTLKTDNANAARLRLLVVAVIGSICSVSNLGFSEPHDANSGIAMDTAPPKYVLFVPPQDFSDVAFKEALRRKLTPEEAKLVINPLSSNPEMNRWAHEMTVGATNDEAKARALFETIAGRACQGIQSTEGTMRTAPEVFAAWNKPGVMLYCQDYTYLYVALARAVGIRAYSVYVQEMADGQQSPHACAAIILGNKGLLVDPTYSWFGAPHKRFIVLNDLEEAGVYLGQLDDLRLSKIASKLAPTVPLVQLNFFENLVNNGRLNEARELLPIIQRLDTNVATATYLQASLALLENKFEDAINLLRKAIAINPHEYTYYEHLAKAYVQAGRPTEGIEAFQNALHCPITTADAEGIKSYLVHTNALVAFSWCCLGYSMQNTGDLVGALTNYDNAIKLQPDYAEAYERRAYVKQLKGDTAGASSDYRRAIQLKPSLERKFNK